MSEYITHKTLTVEQLEGWHKAGLNVLLIGMHGTGKTERILKAWENMGVKGKAFSGATLDPWLDFIGVPRPVENKEGETYLEYIRPDYMADDEIEAIFVDELNRSHKQVKNALFELIQFKSINGKKFPNLKVVWAAINPSDEDDYNYDVSDMDDALEDRFHVIYKLAPNPDKVYFQKKFGDDGVKICNWWASQGKQVRNRISPRRLEYVLQGFYGGEALGSMLPYKGANIRQLTALLKETESVNKLRKMVDRGDGAAVRKFLSSVVNYKEVEEVLKNDNPLVYFCFDFLPDEQKTQLMNQRNILNFAQIRSFIRPGLVPLVSDWQATHNYYMNVFLGIAEEFHVYWAQIKKKVSLGSGELMAINRNKAHDPNYWNKFPKDRFLTVDDIVFLLELDWSFINKTESQNNSAGNQARFGGVLSTLGGFRIADLVFRSLQHHYGEPSLAWLYPDFIKFTDKFIGDIECFKTGDGQLPTLIAPTAPTAPTRRSGPVPAAPQQRTVGNMVPSRIDR